MKRYVADASFLLEAVTVSHSVSARELTCMLEEEESNKLEMWAPGILWYEVANFFTKPKLSFEQSAFFIEQLNALPIRTVQCTARDFLQITHLAREVEASIYDAAYHFLALENEATFLTLDKKYFAKAKGLGSVRLVSS